MMWKTKEPSITLTKDEKLSIIEEFGRWKHADGSQGTVVFTGGEPFKKSEELLALSEKSRMYGLKTAVNTNGTLIDKSIYGDIVERGPDHLVFSLDSWRPELHNWSRGQVNTFERCTNNLKGILAERGKSESSHHVNVVVNTIIYKNNYLEIQKIVETVKKLGADGIMFQPLARTFMNDSKHDDFFENNLPKNINQVDNMVSWLKEEKRKTGFVLTDFDDLDWIRLYFRNPDFIGEQVCDSANRNMMMNMFGEVQLCFGMKTLNNGNPLGNVRESSLQNLWMSQEANRMRSVMSICRRNCGMLNCHRKIKG